MTCTYTQTAFTEDLQKTIYSGFSKAALAATGMDGFRDPPLAFQLHRDGVFVGAVVVHPYWGQLHVKLLYVDEAFRHQGYGQKLMHHAMEFARQRGCDFIFVETMNFQAPRFYQELGFTNELTRHGFANGSSFHYFKYDLKPQ